MGMRHTSTGHKHPFKKEEDNNCVFADGIRVKERSGLRRSTSVTARKDLCRRSTLSCSLSRLITDYDTTLACGRRLRPWDFTEITVPWKRGREYTVYAG